MKIGYFLMQRTDNYLNKEINYVRIYSLIVSSVKHSEFFIFFATRRYNKIIAFETCLFDCTLTKGTWKWSQIFVDKKYDKRLWIMIVLEAHLWYLNLWHLLRYFSEYVIKYDPNFFGYKIIGNMGQVPQLFRLWQVRVFQEYVSGSR